MKWYIFLCTIVACVALIQCSHTFMGTTLMTNEVYHKEVNYASRTFQKRIENLTFNMPPSYQGRSIRGILAYDVTRSGASANVTNGGLGYTFVTLRLKSDRGRKLNYDIYIYA